VKKTGQREILKFLKKNPGKFFTMLEIFEGIKSEGIEISIGSVSRAAKRIGNHKRIYGISQSVAIRCKQKCVTFGYVTGGNFEHKSRY
jgi:hypothetical protein